VHVHPQPGQAITTTAGDTARGNAQPVCVGAHLSCHNACACQLTIRGPPHHPHHHCCRLWLKYHAHPPPPRPSPPPPPCLSPQEVEAVVERLARPRPRDEPGPPALSLSQYQELRQCTFTPAITRGVPKEAVCAHGLTFAHAQSSPHMHIMTGVGRQHGACARVICYMAAVDIGLGAHFSAQPARAWSLCRGRCWCVAWAGSWSSRPWPAARLSSVQRPRLVHSWSTLAQIRPQAHAVAAWLRL
jgi:hypothetical protein